MAFPLRRIAAPTREPVSLAEMKAQLTLDQNFIADDGLLSGMISAARQDAEDFLGQSLVPQQWLFALDRFPSYRYLDVAPARSDYDAFGSAHLSGWRENASQTITLPRSPLIGIDSLEYLATSGQWLILDPASYAVDNLSTPARIQPAFDTAWPFSGPVLNAVQIRFTAGYVEEIDAEPVTVPLTAPYTVALAQAANFTKLLSLTDGGVPVVPLTSAAGFLSFPAPDAGRSLVATYQILSIPPSILIAIKLRAAAYYANREEFLAGVPSPASDWFERLLGGVGRTNIFGYVGR